MSPFGILGAHRWILGLELENTNLPLVHGTSFPVACAICETGFAALSSLDL